MTKKKRMIVFFAIVGAAVAIVVGVQVLRRVGPITLAKERTPTPQPAAVQHTPVVSDAQPAQGLVAYYPFNGNAHDESGSGNHGQVHGATLAADRFGNADSAYSFDGADDHIEIADSDSLDTPDAISIAAWIFPTSSGVRVFISKDSSGGPTREWQLALLKDNKIRAIFWYSSKAYLTAVSDPISLNAWHHVVVTARANDAIRVYIDGQLDGATQFKGNLATGTSKVIIGDLGNLSFPWHGRIDRVAIYARVLDEAEIQALYQETQVTEPPAAASTPPPSGSLVAHYPFDGNADNAVENGNDGTVYGATLDADRFGNADSAYRFDGVDDYVSIPADLGGHREFTMSAWVWIDAEQADEPPYRVILQTGCGAISYYVTEDPFQVGIFADRDGGASTGTATHHYYRFPMDDVQAAWRQVTFVGYENDTARFYVDGVKVPIGERGTNPFNRDYNTTIIGAKGGPQDKRIGQHFSGLIDDVRFYDYALTEGEVQALYTRDTNPDLVAYYPFNGNANDESGSGNHGQVHGATLAADRFGNADSAYGFDGVDDYVDMGNQVIPEGEVSFSVWFRTDNLKYVQTILGNYVRCSYSGTGFVLIYYGDQAKGGPELRFAMGSKRSTAITPIQHLSSVSDNTWHHVVGVFQDGQFAFYLDNVLVGSAEASYNPTSVPLRIGWSPAAAGCGNESYLRGDMDDLQIYDHALSESEIESLYQEGGWMEK